MFCTNLMGWESGPANGTLVHNDWYHRHGVKASVRRYHEIISTRNGIEVILHQDIPGLGRSIHDTALNVLTVLFIRTFLV